MTEFEKERDEAALNYFVMGIEITPDDYLPMAFKAGADWANARAEKKVQGLVEALEFYAGGEVIFVTGEVNVNVAKKALAEYRGEK